ncbi:NuA4 histone acetyltransferase subunit [Dimargaris xerosporica]|nr:NuA4 histone acetyltransferase subunit [Dimargaris xerosporica]
MADGTKLSDDTQVEPAANSKPSRPKRYIGDTEISAVRSGMTLKNPLQDKIVQDWDLLEDVWSYCFYNRLRVNPKENPLFVTEASWNVPAAREKLIELAFEKFEAPAFYVCKDAVLAAFAAGKSNALVLDCGGSTTSAVPVYDGYALKKGQLYQNIAGDFVSDQILAQIRRDFNLEVRSRYQVLKKNPVDVGQPADVVLRDLPNGEITPSYHHYMQMQVIQEYKESVCQISESTYNENYLAARPQKPFEFPDGFNLQVGIERFRVPEVLFQPNQFIADKSKPVRQNGQVVDVSGMTPGPAVEGATAQTPSSSFNLWGVPQMIYNSVNSCDIDLRPHLLTNVVLTGGTTLFPGFADRVNFELQTLAAGQRIKIHAPGNSIERKYGTWIGGSILSSLGSFHQLWISRQEYQESGAAIVNKKCQ